MAIENGTKHINNGKWLKFVYIMACKSDSESEAKSLLSLLPLYCYNSYHRYLKKNHVVFHTYILQVVNPNTGLYIPYT